MRPATRACQMKPRWGLRVCAAWKGNHRRTLMWPRIRRRAVWARAVPGAMAVRRYASGPARGARRGRRRRTRPARGPGRARRRPPGQRLARRIAPAEDRRSSSECDRRPEIATQCDAEPMEQGVDLVPLLVAGVGAGEHSHTGDVGGRAAPARDPRGLVVIHAGCAPVGVGVGVTRSSPGVDQAHVDHLLLIASYLPRSTGDRGTERCVPRLVPQPRAPSPCGRRLRMFLRGASWSRESSGELRWITISMSGEFLRTVTPIC